MNLRGAAVLLGLLAAASAPAAAEDRVELFGYFESQIMGASVKGDFLQLQSNKLRLDFRSRPADSVAFGANINLITYHGKTEWNILDYLSDSIKSQVQEGIRDAYRLLFTNRSYLDNAWLKLTMGRFDLTIGRQQISPGTGYAWNPTDLFNTKDLMDPTYEQPGHNALRLDTALGRGAALALLYSPGEEWDDSDCMLELKGRWGRFDLTLTAAGRTWRFHDYTWFDPVESTFPEQPERRNMLGASTAGELLGLGVWAEFAYNWMSRSRDFTEMLAGADYTFDNQTYVMLEYYRSAQGRGNWRDYTLNDWMRYLAAEQRAITRDQIYLFARHPVTDLIQAGVSVIAGLSDGSAALVPTLTTSFSDQVEIMAYLNLYLGREGTLYGRNLGSGGLLRVRVYF